MSGCQIVHVVDDDSSIRTGLSNLLKSMGFGVAIHGSPDAFVASTHPSDSGCVLLDIRFPDSNGLDFLERHCLAELPMPVIIMTGQPDLGSSIRGFRAGAVDFLIKPFEQAELLRAVNIALHRDSARHAGGASLEAARARYATLTQREKEVMALVTSGLMNKQVAGKLSLSEITVKVHRGSMMRKMGLRTLADLVRVDEALKAARLSSETTTPWTGRSRDENGRTGAAA